VGTTLALTPSQRHIGGAGDVMNTFGSILFVLGITLIGASACDACTKDSPREELREDIDQAGENVDDAVDESRIGMNR
jgi:hypothetical protein